MKYKLKIMSNLWVVFLTVLVLVFTASQVVFADNNLDLDSFFNLEQETGVQRGTTKRYIDVSSPWSGGYLYDNMVVEGKVEIKENFSMNNMNPGSGSVSQASGSQGSSTNRSNAEQQNSNNNSTGYVNDGGSRKAVDIPMMEDGSVKSSSVGASSGSADHLHPIYGSSPEPDDDLLYFKIPQWSDLF